LREIALSESCLDAFVRLILTMILSLYSAK
jgi:hypothetical protein